MHVLSALIIFLTTELDISRDCISVSNATKTSLTSAQSNGPTGNTKLTGALAEKRPNLASTDRQADRGGNTRSDVLVNRSLLGAETTHF